MGLARIKQWVPGALYGAPLRWATPDLAGQSDAHHIALTFDDGPDPNSTPEILKTLQFYSKKATFFLVGEHIEANRDLVKRMHTDGHEIAVHGWTHRSVLRIPPARLHDELRRTADLIAKITGGPPRWYRPPYGITTLASNWAAREASLTPVLWTAWGRDWSAGRQGADITETVQRTLRPGGTVLLHDTDRYASPDSWRQTELALSSLLTIWGSESMPVGTIADHWA